MAADFVERVRQDLHRSSQGRMKILLISPEYPSIRSGGIGTFFRAIGRQLCRMGHEVTILIYGEHEPFEDDGIRVCFIRPSKMPRLGWVLNRRALQRAVQERIQNEGVDVVEAPDWCGLTAGLRPRVPLLIRCHGSETYFAHVLERKVKWKTRAAEQLACRGADDIAAVGAHCADITAKLFGLKNRPRVIYNGVDTSVFVPKSGESGGTKRALIVGTLVRKKGSLDLPKLIERLCSSSPDMEVRIVGRDCGDRETGARSMWEIVRTGVPPKLQGRVVYLGEQPAARVRDEMQEASVCLFPSYAEALPIAWLEAMACGCPVVAYDGGWSREIIEDGTNGYLVEKGDIAGMADAAGRLIRNPGLRAQFGERARQSVEGRFTIEHCAANTVQWYSEQIGFWRGRREIRVDGAGCS